MLKQLKIFIMWEHPRSTEMRTEVWTVLVCLQQLSSVVVCVDTEVGFTLSGQPAEKVAWCQKWSKMASFLFCFIVFIWFFFHVHPESNQLSPVICMKQVQLGRCDLWLYSSLETDCRVETLCAGRCDAKFVVFYITNLSRRTWQFGLT